MTGRRKKHVDEDFIMSEDTLNPQIKLLTKIKVDLKCKNERQKNFVNLIENKDVVVAAGPAGTGKTFVACAKALRLLATNPQKYKQIIIAKSVTVLEGEDIGFLKGTMKEKMEPFMFSFMDNFHKLIGKDLSNDLLAAELIEILPIAYIRGRSIDNTIIIVDESQNLPKHHLISVFTRIGYDSKMIFMADEDQIDLTYKDKSGISWFIQKCESLEEIGIVKFEESDIVRNPLIAKFLNHIKNKNID
jgi:phosphate starvation-inducible PhoH-like protein